MVVTVVVGSFIHLKTSAYIRFPVGTCFCSHDVGIPRIIVWVCECSLYGYGSVCV